MKGYKVFFFAIPRKRGRSGRQLGVCPLLPEQVILKILLTDTSSRGYPIAHHFITSIIIQYLAYANLIDSDIRAIDVWFIFHWQSKALNTEVRLMSLQYS